MKHTRTSSSSYERDFRELIEVYTRNPKYSKKTNLPQKNISVGTSSEDKINKIWLDDAEERASSSESDEDITLPNDSCVPALKRKELSVEYLEDECDLFLDVDDFDGNLDPSTL